MLIKQDNLYTCNLQCSHNDVNDDLSVNLHACTHTSSIYVFSLAFMPFLHANKSEYQLSISPWSHCQSFSCSKLQTVVCVGEVHTQFLHVVFVMSSFRNLNTEFVHPALHRTTWKTFHFSVWLLEYIHFLFHVFLWRTQSSNSVLTFSNELITKTTWWIFVCRCTLHSTHYTIWARCYGRCAFNRMFGGRWEIMDRCGLHIMERKTYNKISIHTECRRTN